MLRKMKTSQTFENFHSSPEKKFVRKYLSPPTFLKFLSIASAKKLSKFVKIFVWTNKFISRLKLSVAFLQPNFSNFSRTKFIFSRSQIFLVNVTWKFSRIGFFPETILLLFSFRRTQLEVGSFVNNKLQKLELNYPFFISPKLKLSSAKISAQKLLLPNFLQVETSVENKLYKLHADKTFRGNK